MQEKTAQKVNPLSVDWWEKQIVEERTYNSYADGFVGEEATVEYVVQWNDRWTFCNEVLQGKRLVYKGGTKMKAQNATMVESTEGFYPVDPTIKAALVTVEFSNLYLRSEGTGSISIDDQDERIPANE